MALSIYIETTIAGHLTSRLPKKDEEIARQMLATRAWWRQDAHRFELVTSRLVREEASEGDPVAAAERLAGLAGIVEVPVTDLAIKLADDLLARAALPAKARVDALHLGTAAANGLDFLLTWNCRHLANRVLRGKIEDVCRDAGFEPPIICTPYDLMEIAP